MDLLQPAAHHARISFVVLSYWCGRAAMAVLRQQLVFVDRLVHSGMVTEQVSEAHHECTLDVIRY